jgi:hypothetical protein
MHIMPDKLPANTIGELRDILCEWIVSIGVNALLIAECGLAGIQVERLGDVVMLRPIPAIENACQLIEERRRAALASFLART